MHRCRAVSRLADFKHRKSLLHAAGCLTWNGPTLSQTSRKDGPPGGHFHDLGAVIVVNGLERFLTSVRNDAVSLDGCAYNTHRLSRLAAMGITTCPPL